MASTIVKVQTTTRIKHSLVVVKDGVPSFEEQPDFIVKGTVTDERAKRLLEKKYGKERQVVFLSAKPETHRYVMDFDDFLRYARVEDEDTESAEESESSQE